MKQALFVAVVTSTLGAALACGEREEYKGSGSRSLEDPSADGGRVISSSSGGSDASTDAKVDGDAIDTGPDAFVFDTGSDAKNDG